MTANELKELMLVHRLSVTDLQTIMVCTERQIYRYLSGETELKGARLALLGRHFNVCFIDPQNR